MYEAVVVLRSVAVLLLYGGHDAVGQRREPPRHPRHARADRLAHLHTRTHPTLHYTTVYT